MGTVILGCRSCLEPGRSRDPTTERSLIGKAPPTESRTKALCDSWMLHTQLGKFFTRDHTNNVAPAFIGLLTLCGMEDNTTNSSASHDQTMTGRANVLYHGGSDLHLNID